MTIERLRASLSDRYSLERELGAGGMATVYLAEDLKHERKVAIKVLRPELAAVIGAERFLKEVKTTANLQHPHILGLIDSGESDSFLWYAMPYVDGESLRDRLDREKQLPIGDAVRLATEVAGALDYAHRHGVIHRDIKPENILLHDGSALVADFGIALAASTAGSRMTETGMSLGTPHYMSPEQAMGERDLDARSDVYALGCVLYEMLAGEPPFTGPTAQSIVAKVMTATPEPITTYRKTVPPAVERAVHVAIQKLPADRFATAAEFAGALGDRGFTATVSAATGNDQPRGAPKRLVIGLAAALAAVTIVATWALTRPAPSRPVGRYGLALPGAQQPDPAGFAMITADGSAIIYQGFTSSGISQLWIKRREQLTATPVPGTEAVSSAALSPDGSQLAVVQGGSLRSGPLGGGAFGELGNQVSGGTRSVTWLDNSTLAFVDRNQSEILTVGLNDADPRVAFASDSLTFSNLSSLPDGRGIIFQACVRPCAEANLHLLDFATGESRRIVVGAWWGQLLPTGDLFYVREDLTGMVVPFDLGARAPRGTPVAVLDSISPSFGAAPYVAVSRSGTLVMRRGVTAGAREFELVIMERDGVATPVDPSFTFRNTQFAANFGWSVSPDGRTVAIGVNTSAGDDIWVKPLSGGPAARVTFGRGSESRPRWTRDGRSVTFVTDEGIYMHRADGAGQDSLLRAGGYDEALLSPDGTWLLFRLGAKSASAGFRDIFGVRVGGDTTAVPIVASQYDEMAIALSPDGNWLAYQSDETGILEVFIRPFPNTSDAKIPVSSGGGTGPLWSRDGRELYYITPDLRMMAVPIERAPDGERDRLRLGTQQALFRLEGGLGQLGARYYTPWDITPSGRFVMVQPVATDNVTTGEGEALIVVEHWFDELKGKLPR